MTEYIPRGITLSALLVGTLIVGKKYYENWMSNKWIKILENDLNNEYDQSNFINTLIDNDCSNRKLNKVSNTYNLNTDTFRNVHIKIGTKGNLKKLLSFNILDNTIIYEFEDKYILTLNNNGETNTVTYSFQAPSFYLLKQLNDNNIQLYRKNNEILN
jgi:hypothetical protein